MSISRMQEGDSPLASDRSPAIQELERLLREQVALNAQLDAELRYLLQELTVRKEFIARLEDELEAMHSLAGRQIELVAEFTAYRARTSHRIVDRLVIRIHHLPWLYRPLKQLSRVVNVITMGRRPPSTDSSLSVNRLPDDNGSVDHRARYSRKPQ